MTKFKLIATAILLSVFLSNICYAEILLFTLESGASYDLSPLNNSNIDDSSLVINLYSDKFKNDFWNFDGDDVPLNFLDEYNFQFSHKETSVSSVYDGVYYINNHIFHYDEYLKSIRDEFRVSISFDNYYNIDISPAFDFSELSYSVQYDSYEDDEGNTAIVIDHYIYYVLPSEFYYRYGLSEPLNDFMNSEYFKDNGFGTATVNVTESSTYSIKDGFWKTSYTSDYSNEEIPIPTPEPGTGFLVAFGGVVFLNCFRRMRSKM